MSAQTSAAVRAYFAANPQDAAADRAGCFGMGDGSTVTETRNFTLGTTTKANAVPSTWQGRYVRITPHGSTLYYYFAFAAGTCAAPPAATDAGASAATAGEGPIADNVTMEVRVPTAAAGGAVYFCRVGGTDAQSVQMTLADGTRGTTGE